MQHSAAFLIACVTLVLPGPTNVLLALAGTSSGFCRAAHFALAAVVGYGLAVGALAFVASPLIAAVPVVGKILRLAAAAVLLHASVRLWRYPGQTADLSTRPVSWSHIFFTTLLNPKALVLAALVLSEETAAHSINPVAATLPVLVAASALAWIWLGAAMKSWMPALATAGWIERGGSIVLFTFAAAVVTTVLHRT